MAIENIEVGSASGSTAKEQEKTQKTALLC